MKKVNHVPDEPRAEYQRSDFGRLERGKYHERVKAHSNVVVLDEEMSAIFPNSDSVNKALHSLVEVAERTTGISRNTSHPAKSTTS